MYIYILFGIWGALEFDWLFLVPSLMGVGSGMVVYVGATTSTRRTTRKCASIIISRYYYYYY